MAKPITVHVQTLTLLACIVVLGLTWILVEMRHPLALGATLGAASVAALAIFLARMLRRDGRLRGLAVPMLGVKTLAVVGIAYWALTHLEVDPLMFAVGVAAGFMINTAAILVCELFV